ncbi:hypothetical protein COCC4DRAFT_69170 [Bipolaris maydis ATCC 48331]|uniref:Uncharacterized protein n=2 Tax=Cochliobolus heterostrophus TaxID=5016 RepID=M2TZN7_COCH5|nr:uncharacterized protein COCC4DRAFT_69170 [Bipolaris maydis ATCC 48331]EMD91744.1 hypothetical protein COCHEDRAFT_1194494 [Bipolaris maydis C5]ENI08497.1 hypothetical protein COCC4DRAFT_69170 [Bipolaris maydis ATCC 48331]
MGQSMPGDMFRGSLLGVSRPSSQGHVQSARHPLPIGATHAAHFAACGWVHCCRPTPPTIHPPIHPSMASPRLALHSDKPTRPSLQQALQQCATTHDTTIAGRARGPPPFRAGAPPSTPLATLAHVTHRSLLLAATYPHVQHTFIRAYT